jgi:hypothetical protein
LKNKKTGNKPIIQRCLLNDDDIQDGVIKRFLDIRDGALEVFLVLLASADSEGYSELSLAQIVKTCGFSRWKVQFCVEALENAKYVIRELKGIAGKVMIYKITKDIS